MALVYVLYVCFYNGGCIVREFKHVEECTRTGNILYNKYKQHYSGRVPPICIAQRKD